MGAVVDFVKGGLIPGMLLKSFTGGGDSQPAPQRKPPPTTTTSEQTIRSSIVDAQSSQRRRAAGLTKTVYTSPLGLSNGGATAQPTLLGG